LRFISYALLAGGLIAISAGLYFEQSGATSHAAQASAPNPTATAMATSTVVRTAPPASILEPTPTLTPEPGPEVETAAVEASEEPVQPVEPSQMLQALASAPTQPAVEKPAATATPRPPTPTEAPPPPPPTATPVPPQPPAAPVSLAGLEQQMFAAHNAERASNGVAALQIDATLTQLARTRAQDMASKNYFAHTSPTGQTAFSLLNASGYVYTLAGENLARNNYPDDQSVSVAMSGFMASPAHRVNVLEPKFSRVGIGMAVGADGMKYFAVIFAAK
jgi:uncharacterized protein YkwD